MAVIVVENLIAIDPGNVTGFALFVRGPGENADRNVLTECGITKGRYLPAHGKRYHVAIERPQADDRQTKDGKPIPLTSKMTLAWNAGKQAGWYEAFGHTVGEVEPRAWKAQLSKEQCWEQVKIRLTDSERAMVYEARRSIADSYAHNMYDAIGIGMTVLGRFRVRG